MPLCDIKLHYFVWWEALGYYVIEQRFSIFFLSQHLYGLSVFWVLQLNQMYVVYYTVYRGLPCMQISYLQIHLSTNWVQAHPLHDPSRWSSQFSRGHRLTELNREPDWFLVVHETRSDLFNALQGPLSVYGLCWAQTALRRVGGRHLSISSVLSFCEFSHISPKLVLKYCEYIYYSFTPPFSTKGTQSI